MPSPLNNWKKPPKIPKLLKYLKFTLWLRNCCWEIPQNSKKSLKSVESFPQSTTKFQCRKKITSLPSIKKLDEVTSRETAFFFYPIKGIKNAFNLQSKKIWSNYVKHLVITTSLCWVSWSPVPNIVLKSQSPIDQVPPLKKRDPESAQEMFPMFKNNFPFVKYYLLCPVNSSKKPKAKISVRSACLGCKTKVNSKYGGWGRSIINYNKFRNQNPAGKCLKKASPPKQDPLKIIGFETNSNRFPPPAQTKKITIFPFLGNSQCPWQIKKICSWTPIGLSNPSGDNYTNFHLKMNGPPPYTPKKN